MDLPTTSAPDIGGQKPLYRPMPRKDYTRSEGYGLDKQNRRSKTIADKKLRVLHLINELIEALQELAKSPELKR